ncbi:MAG: hypothetical protein AB4041_02125 [Microcystaceae cyanobacterium]
MSDETEALKHTETELLWQAIIDHTGLLGHLSTETETKVHHIFQEMDQDNSGSISLSELRSYLQEIDSQFSN